MQHVDINICFERSLQCTVPIRHPADMLLKCSARLVARCCCGLHFRMCLTRRWQCCALQSKPVCVTLAEDLLSDVALQDKEGTDLAQQVDFLESKWRQPVTICRRCSCLAQPPHSSDSFRGEKEVHCSMLSTEPANCSGVVRRSVVMHLCPKKTSQLMRD